MTTSTIIILSVAAVVVLVLGYVAGFHRGTKHGIRFAMNYTINRTVRELRDGFERIGRGGMFDKVVKQTLDIRELELYNQKEDEQ